MKINDIKEYLRKQENIPEDESERAKWFELNDTLNFLLNTRQEMVPIYASYGTGFYIYSVIVPISNLKSDYIEQFMEWGFPPSSGYSYSLCFDQPCILDPMDEGGIFENSIPIFFARYFEGKDDYFPLEINQKIEQVLNIHWLENKKGFFRIDELGEYVKIATMENDEEKNFSLCTLNREDLDFYLFLSQSVLVRVFSFHRSSEDSSFPPNYDNRQEMEYRNNSEETYADLIMDYKDDGSSEFSQASGFQIIRNQEDPQKMINKISGKEDRDYESFIISDFRNKRVIEWSSDPKELGNYFVDSDLPFETSPAFFKADVLSKYKQNPSKYTLGTRSIECRGGWSIDYDINEEGQVHVYIYKLSRLPYAEQKYWKSCNVEPKAGISPRSFKSDFMGEWDEEYDPLISLKNILKKFPCAEFEDETAAIWQMPRLPKTRDINFLNYVVTDSEKEWEDQIEALYQIVNEGLSAKNIKKLAVHLNCRDKKLKSGKQLIKCLETIGIPEEEYGVIGETLTEIWKLRSTIVAHSGSDEYPTDDLRIHYRNLIERCDKSMHKLSEFINKGLLNISEDK